MYEQALQLIKEYDRIIIHRHLRPDGDAIGSQTGLCLLIRDNFPEKNVSIVGDAPGRYGFLPGSDPETVVAEEYRGALAIVLDCSSPALVAGPDYNQAAATLRLDHHLFVERMCGVEVVDTTAESCCGMISDFAAESGLRISEDAATALFCGLVTDSGRFRYNSVDSKTFSRAARLTEAGADAQFVYSRLYSESYDKVKRRAEYVLKIRFTGNGTAYIYTTAEELAAMGADPYAISRGMVGVMSDLRGVDRWVNFTEADGTVLCEIRSSVYNINPVAVKYGGGGHAKASGCTLADREEAMRLLGDLDALGKNADQAGEES